MKITYVVRLFSGLDLSIKSKIWQPTGVPTIYKIIDTLSLKHDLTLILVDKSIQYKGVKENKIKGLNAKVYIVGSYKNILIREIKQLFDIWRLIKKPDLLYIDHSNIILGSLYARFSKIPVIFRVMGCYGIKTSFNNDNVVKKIFRWSYQAPFKCVIVTQDGSGVDYWLDKAINKSVPKEILLNGADKSLINKGNFLNLPVNKSIVLFIGRLDYDKGCVEFISAFIEAFEQNNNLYAVVIGKGSELEKLKEKVYQYGASDAVLFIEEVGHKHILSIQQQSDIYVSLNRAGNLSNANLEAINIGQCMIIPKSKSDTQVDLITDKLLSDKSVRRISSVDNIEEIADAILELHNNPKLRKIMSENLNKEAKQFLWSWDERIKKEMDILENIIRSK